MVSLQSSKTWTQNTPKNTHMLTWQARCGSEWYVPDNHCCAWQVQAYCPESSSNYYLEKREKNLLDTKAFGLLYQNLFLL